LKLIEDLLLIATPAGTFACREGESVEMEVHAANGRGGVELEVVKIFFA
jgi:hypothetical protein